MRKIAQVTIADVAKEAGCSISTVSLVMSDSEKIKAETKTRVLDICRRLGYSRNFAAHSLRNKRTKLLGVIVPNLENPMFSLMINGSESYASSMGYNIILSVTSLSLEKEMSNMRMLSERCVDGLLLFPTYLKELYPILASNNDIRKIPVVLCGSSGLPEIPISYVKCDNRMGAYIATEHLAKIGRKRIACLCAVASEQQALSRIQGYRDALDFYNIPAEDDLVVFCSQDAEDIFNSAIKLINEKQIDAIFCLYDYMSIAVMKAAKRLNLSIPEDIAIVGYDNITVSAFMPTSLTTIDTHGWRVGSMATELLIKKIQDPDMPERQIQLKPELVIRESTGGLPDANKLLYHNFYS